MLITRWQRTTSIAWTMHRCYFLRRISIVCTWGTLAELYFFLGSVRQQKDTTCNFFPLHTNIMFPVKQKHFSSHNFSVASMFNWSSGLIYFYSLQNPTMLQRLNNQKSADYNKRHLKSNKGLRSSDYLQAGTLYNNRLLSR